MKEVFYCPQCKKWRGRNKSCIVCGAECQLAKLPNIRADSYFIDGIDKPLPRVTNIIKLVLANPGLATWITKQSVLAALENPSLSIEEAMAARFVKRDVAGREGTDIHKMIEFLSAGNQLTPEIEQFPKIMAYRKFEKDIPRKILHSEMTVFSEKMGYAGTADEISQIGKDIVLLDYKTGKSVFPTDAIQMTAYKTALVEMGIEIGRMVTIHLRDNAYSFVERPYIPEVWRAVLTIYNWQYND